MTAESEVTNSVPLCDICGTGRAPFLRYGTVERTGRMCADCLRRTRICARCQQPADTGLVPLRLVHQGSGPGWTEYACVPCAGQGADEGRPGG